MKMNARKVSCGHWLINLFFVLFFAVMSVLISLPMIIMVSIAMTIMVHITLTIMIVFGMASYVTAIITYDKTCSNE